MTDAAGDKVADGGGVEDTANDRVDDGAGARVDVTVGGEAWVRVDTRVFVDCLVTGIGESVIGAKLAVLVLDKRPVS